METQLWRPNVGIAELGKDNLYHLGSDGLEAITMVMVEFRRGRSAEKRLALGRAIVDICVELLGVPRHTVMVEFTPHAGQEMLRDGNWAADWIPAERDDQTSTMTGDRYACNQSRTIQRLPGFETGGDSKTGGV
jgi:hypothetical protein